MYATAATRLTAGLPGSLKKFDLLSTCRNMDRRNFIQAFAAFTAFLGFESSCQKRKVVEGNIIGDSAKVGHLLRDNTFSEPVEISRKDVVIIGGGVSGLSAARALNIAGVPILPCLTWSRRSVAIPQAGGTQHRHIPGVRIMFPFPTIH